VQISPNHNSVSDKETLTNYTWVSALKSRSVFQFADCRMFRWDIVHIIERGDEVLPGIMTSRDLPIGGGGETVCVVTIRSPVGAV